MNRNEREVLIEKVRRADNPYEALFGQEQVGRTGKRRRIGQKVGMPSTMALPDKADRHRLAQRVTQRTYQIIKQLDPDLFRDIYNAEMKLAIAKLEDSTAPDQELRRKYKRRFVPAETESRAE